MGVVEISSCDDAELPAAKVGLAGFRERPSPFREELADSPTVPENPLMLVRVIVELPDEPTDRSREVGLAEMVKSTTLTAKVALRVSEALLPVTVTK